MTENGVTTAYRVSDIKMFEKDVETGALKLYGNGSYMNFLTKTAFYHDLALMTCAGASYGNGDASHRLVVFIDKI